MKQTMRRVQAVGSMGSGSRRGRPATCGRTQAQMHSTLGLLFSHEDGPSGADAKLFTRLDWPSALASLHSPLSSPAAWIRA